MGFTAPAGIDEVGLGPLAGPAVAGAVILRLGDRLPGIDDSKKLTAAQRERLARIIRRRAVAWAVHEVPPAVIDTDGLTRARELAMEGAVRSLAVAADYLLIDAWDVPALPLPQMCVVKGDSTSASIMAASIVAKVYRDAPDGGSGRSVPRVRVRDPQGVRHGGSPPGPARARSVTHPPDELGPDPGRARGAGRGG